MAMTKQESRWWVLDLLEKNSNLSVDNVARLASEEKISLPKWAIANIRREFSLRKGNKRVEAVANEIPRFRQEPVCALCEQKGHWANQCPNPPAPTYKEEETVDGDQKVAPRSLGTGHKKEDAEERKLYSLSLLEADPSLHPFQINGVVMSRYGIGMNTDWLYEQCRELRTKLKLEPLLPHNSGPRKPGIRTALPGVPFPQVDMPDTTTVAVVAPTLEEMATIIEKMPYKEAVDLLADLLKKVWVQHQGLEATLALKGGKVKLNLAIMQTQEYER